MATDLLVQTLRGLGRIPTALVGGALISVASNPAQSAPIKFHPLLDARLRFENVAQDEIEREATALTTRLRAGVEARQGAWRALIEGQATKAIIDRYFDGLRGGATRPLVADPENLALYRAQVQYSTDIIGVTVGRQCISLDDDRFVDSALFRQERGDLRCPSHRMVGRAEAKGRRHLCLERRDGMGTRRPRREATGQSRVTIYSRT